MIDHAPSLEEQIVHMSEIVHESNPVIPCLWCKAILASLRELQIARRLVDQQAEDDGLWFSARHITEGYLQQALRNLHAAIEGEPLPFPDMHP